MSEGNKTQLWMNCGSISSHFLCNISLSVQILFLLSPLLLRSILITPCCMHLYCRFFRSVAKNRMVYIPINNNLTGEQSFYGSIESFPTFYLAILLLFGRSYSFGDWFLWFMKSDDSKHTQIHQNIYDTRRLNHKCQMNWSIIIIFVFSFY